MAVIMVKSYCFTLHLYCVSCVYVCLLCMNLWAVYEADTNLKSSIKLDVTHWTLNLRHQCSGQCVHTPCSHPCQRHMRPGLHTGWPAAAGTRLPGGSAA